MLRRRARDPLRLAPPGWLHFGEDTDDMVGANDGQLAEGSTLALEAFGDACQRPESSASALLYLQRRFGPSPSGYDDYKEAARYILTTRDPDVLLVVGIRVSGLRYGIGYRVRASVADRFDRPARDWWHRFGLWRKRLGYQASLEEDSPEVLAECMTQAAVDLGPRPCPVRPATWRGSHGLLRRVNQSLFDALEELKRPIPLSDGLLNVLGRCEFVEGVRPAPLPACVGQGVAYLRVNPTQERTVPAHPGFEVT